MLRYFCRCCIREAPPPLPPPLPASPIPKPHVPSPPPSPPLPPLPGLVDITLNELPNPKPIKIPPRLVI